MQHGRLLKSVIITCLVITGFAGRGLADSAPPVAAEVIRQTEKWFLEHGAMYHEPKEYTDTFVDYLHKLRSDWSATLQKSPQEFPELVKPFHMAFQFYFGKKTDYEARTIDALLRPILPLKLEGANLTDTDRLDLEKTGLKLRLAWLRLFHELDPKKVLEDDPMLHSIGITLQFVHDLSDPYLGKLVTGDDLTTIMDTIRAIPYFSDDYIKQLVLIHEERFPKYGIYGQMGFADRCDRYKRRSEDLRPPHWLYISMMYRNIWNSSPAAMESRASALNLWINNELDYVAAVLDAAGKLKEGKNKVIPNYAKFLGDSLQIIKNAEVLHVAKVKEVGTTKLSEKDMALVRELNQYLQYNGQEFEVDYVSESSNVLASLQAGNWKYAVAAVQPTDKSMNLTLPIAEFADYVKRHPTDEFKADLEQIYVRLEALQSLASAMAAQQ